MDRFGGSGDDEVTAVREEATKERRGCLGREIGSGVDGREISVEAVRGGGGSRM